MKLSITQGIVGALAFAILSVIVLTWQSQNSDASTNWGSEYNATTTTSIDVGTSTLSTMAGTIGSIVVSSTSPVSAVGPYIAFYDTSSTSIATTSMVAKFSFGSRGGVTPPAGDYVFDVAFGQGIYMWIDPSFNGSYTITYR